MTASYRRPGYNPWKYRTQRPVRMNRDSWQSHGLVAWWPTLGVYGSDKLLDLGLTKAYNLDWQGGTEDPAWVVDPEFGPVLSYSNDYLFVLATPLTGVPLTMACWFNSTNITDSQTLIAIQDSTGDKNWFRVAAMGSLAGDPIRAHHFRESVGATADTTTGYTANKWHHACAVFEAAASRHAYLDAGSKATNTTNLLNPSGLNSVAIGELRDSTPTQPMQGLIADARIYNRALSDYEVAALYAPRTRWELYAPPRRIWAIAPAAPVGRTTKNTDSHPLGIHTGMSWRLPTHP